MVESDKDYATDTSLVNNQCVPTVEEVNEGDNVENVRLLLFLFLTVL